MPFPLLDAATLDLLDRLTGRRWRDRDLRLRRWLPEAPAGAASRPPSPPERRLPTDPIERAWRLALHFDRSADRRRGLHGTPRPVARELARMVLPAVGQSPEALPDVLVDPACGAGALLVAGLERCRALAPDERAPNVVGYDVDPLAIARTEAVLWLAAGQPERPVGHLERRDVVRDGLGQHDADGSDSRRLVMANPPWGIKPSPLALETWRARNGDAIASLLQGEVNIYTLFLLEIVLTERVGAGFVTPIHWLHRRSLTDLRRALCDSGRLAEVTVLRKRVFADAPDMIPALTRWLDRAPDEPSRQRIPLRRTGFRAPIPLPDPVPATPRADVARSTWRALPFCAFPLLRTRRFEALERLFFGWPRLSDPDAPRPTRWLHLGDGAYKTRVRPHVVPAPAQHVAMPILTRAAQVGRYRLDPAVEWLSKAGAEALSDGERERFAGPKVLLHAIKKAAAAWRLGGAVHDPATPDAARAGRPLALTNNFLVGVAEAYDGDLFYVLTLLNSRLFNRLYTEQFPGVNIEAYTVGALPFAWPPAPDAATPASPGVSSDPLEWLAWSRALAPERPAVATTVYRWLIRSGRRLQTRDLDPAEAAGLERCIEGVVAGAFGLADTELQGLLDVDPWDDV